MQHPAPQLLLVAVHCFMLHKHEVTPYTHGAASTVNTRANPELGPVTANANALCEWTFSQDHNGAYCTPVNYIDYSTYPLPS